MKMYTIIFKPFIFWSLFGIATAGFYLDCNSSQTEYFETEKQMFGVDLQESVFDHKSFLDVDIVHFPTSCLEDGKRVENPFFVNYITGYTNVEGPLQLYTHLPSKIANYITDYLWKKLGYVYITQNNEFFWYYNNTKTDNIVIYFHGINLMNGLENVYLLHQLTKHYSVYVALYAQVFILDHNYNTTYSNHVDNIISFIQQIPKLKRVALVGNSHGSLRITTICKRYNCNQISKIVLTDAININLPFSLLTKGVLHGVYMKTRFSPAYSSSSLLYTVRSNKFYVFFSHNLDWYDMSIDYKFMNYYKNNLVLVIGKKDDMMQNINTQSIAMTTTCRILYTNTEHGLLVFTRFLDQIELFESA